MRKLTRLLPVLSILALVMAVTASVSAAANFEIESPTISPNPAEEGAAVTISCVVSNTGNVTGTYTLELNINGTATQTQFTDSESVTLDAGGSQTVNFQITAGLPDTYIVQLGDWSDYLTVPGQASFFGIFDTWVWWVIGGIIVVLIILVIAIVVMPSRKKQAGAAMKGRQGLPYAQGAPPPTPGYGPSGQQFGYPGTPPQPPGAFPTPGPFPAPGPMTEQYPQYARRPMFSVTNLTITPNQVKAGEPVTINAIVSNTGSETGTYSVVLRINGVVENITDLVLAPGASQSATVTVIKDGGEYYAEMDGLSGTFIVIPLVPANFSVRNLVIAPERAKQGEKINISAIVTNSGEVAGTYSLELKLKGAIETTEEITLNPGESQKVTFGITKNTPGFYNVELEGLTGRFVVEMEWQE
jgi:uncharacterized cupredoxin-like copper-binding protein